MKIKNITIKKPDVSYPDVDTDFGENLETGYNRDTIVDYLIDKYGRDYVAMCGNRLLYSGKSVLRDLGNVYDIPAQETFAATKEYNNSLTVRENMEMSKVVADYFEQYPQLIDKVDRIVGTVSGLGIHAGGVVISDKARNFSLRKWCALQRSSDDGRIATLWTKKEVEQIGLIKYDILGLSSATQIHYTQKLAGLKTYSDYVEDADVFRDIVLNKKHINIFQFETYIGRQAFEDFKPMNIMEIANASGLIRVLGSDAGRELYDRYKKNVTAIQMGEDKYWIEELEDSIIEKHNLKVAKNVLAESYGVLIYQEQLSYLCVGFSKGEKSFVDGNKLRKLLDKHGEKYGSINDVQGNPEALKKWHNDFMVIMNEYILPYIGKDGWGNPDNDVQNFLNFKLRSDNTIPVPKNGIISWMISSAAYLFSKLHAIAYSINTYNMMYLKYYYPLQFWTASLISEQQSLEKVKMYINAIRSEDCGIEILPPDINKSDRSFTMTVGDDYDYIRYGLSSIMNLGKSADVIIKERNKNGPYTSVVDFLNRVPSRIVNKRVIENLLYVNAFNSFGTIENVYKELKKHKDLDELVDDSDFLAKKEMALLGVNITYKHPLLDTACNYRAVPEMYNGETAQVAVSILKTYNKRTRNGKPYIMGRVQDLNSNDIINVFDWANGEGYKMKDGDMAVLNVKKDGDFYTLAMVKRRRW